MRSTIPSAVSRRSVLVGTLAAACFACAKPERPARVLFVCEHGTVKSPIARELMRRRAAERGIRVDVQSRGIAPEDGILPPLAAALERENIDTLRDPLARLTPADGEWADIVVFFNPLPAPPSGKDLRDWSATPSPNSDYETSMQSLSDQIDGLLDSIERQGSGPA